MQHAKNNKILYIFQSSSRRNIKRENKFINQQIKQSQRYLRESLVENEKNLNLGDAYQNYIYNCGKRCGNSSAFCPCNPFVEYPYKKNRIINYLRFEKYVKTIIKQLTQSQCLLAYHILILLLINLQKLIVEPK